MPKVSSTKISDLDGAYLVRQRGDAASRGRARSPGAPAQSFCAPDDAGDSQLMSSKGVGRGVSAVGERGGRGAY